MKHIYHCVFIALCASAFVTNMAQAQALVNDEITMNPGYADMVYYSFSEAGVTGTTNFITNQSRGPRKELSPASVL